MATQNGKSSDHIIKYFLNLMCMHFFAEPNAAEVKLSFNSKS